MLIKGIDEKEYKINLSKYYDKQRKNSSNLHTQAREVIKDIFPNHVILEEVRLPGSKEHGVARAKELYADFLIPSLRIIVEVHGQQHYEFCKHYHRTKLDFLLAQKRDRTKRYWCEINDIIYIELPYNESAEQWADRIKSR
jgi:very-short-patch-repair endonuclease